MSRLSFGFPFKVAALMRRAFIFLLHQPNTFLIQYNFLHKKRFSFLAVI